jgi:prostaglandin-endoperoxide synthase 2
VSIDKTRRVGVEPDDRGLRVQQKRETSLRRGVEKAPRSGVATIVSSRPSRSVRAGKREQAGRESSVNRYRDRTRLPRVAKSIAASLIEGAAVWAWLRLSEGGDPWLGFACLAAGQTLETAFLSFGIRNAAFERWGVPEPADPSHFRRVSRIIWVTGILEVGIWMLWLVSFDSLDDAGRTYQIAGAGVVLLVLMHLKHHVENATVCDTQFREGIFSKRGVFASAMEAVGAVACLALIEDDRFVLAGVAVFGGLLIEHMLLIGSLAREVEARDVRRPRDRRWKPPLQREWRFFFVTHFRRSWKLAERIGPLARRINRSGINYLISVVDSRPNPLSTMTPYTSWPSLTDRHYSGRHLPPASSNGSANTLTSLPDEDTVAALFKREGAMIKCPKSTVLFGWFAQWFTDGFLRTSRTIGRNGVRETLTNESNHDIDLSQLYGREAAITDQLRAHSGGMLRSQQIRGEEYPVYLCEYGRRKPSFSKLPTPLGFDRLTMAQRDRLFAMGTDVTNLGFVACNVLFLREHNRIARELSDANPCWEDERVFQTARNVLTVVLLKIVVEDYINHISAAHFRHRLAPESFTNEPWYRPNWMAIEFNLLYRWHSLTPSTFCLNGAALSVEDTRADTTPLTDTGLGPLMAAASNQPAGRIGLFNTDAWFSQRVERPSIQQARNADLGSYNDYRRLCRYPPATDWDEISSDERVQRRLKAAYGRVDKVELYVGLFAEDTQPNGVLPWLMNTMVAFDALSQAMTNPLLAPRIYTPQTFSDAGWKIIGETNRLSDIVCRNVPSGSDHFVSFTRRDFKRV